MGGHQHPVHPLAGALQRRAVDQVGGHHLGAQRGQVGGLFGVATGRAHRHAATAQGGDQGPTECAAGADDEDLHGGD